MSFIQFIKSKAFFKQIAIALVLSIIFIFALRWWLGVTTNHDQKIQVPNLQKMSLSDVAQKLNELDLDFIVIDSASFNPTYPPKSVIEQTPEAGDFVKERRKIYLTLNPSKYRDISLPNLNGKTRRQATTHLRSIGFKVSNKVTWIPDIGKNVVRGIKYNGKRIKAGTKLPKNTTIELILGDGRQ